MRTFVIGLASDGKTVEEYAPGDDKVRAVVAFADADILNTYREPVVSADGKRLAVLNAYSISASQSLDYFNVVVLNLERKEVEWIDPSRTPYRYFTWVASNALLLVECLEGRCRASRIEFPGGFVTKVPLPAIRKVRAIFSDPAFTILFGLADEDPIRRKIWLAPSGSLTFSEVPLEKTLGARSVWIDNVFPCFSSGQGIRVGAITTSSRSGSDKRVVIQKHLLLHSPAVARTEILFDLTNLKMTDIPVFLSADCKHGVVYRTGGDGKNEAYLLDLKTNNIAGRLNLPFFFWGRWQAVSQLPSRWVEKGGSWSLGALMELRGRQDAGPNGDTKR
jgi:hypothetical protein